ncbi:MAG: endopeptidase [Clostridiales bacterium]|nr:endopeptidase [Clostridiales bacterium]MDN5281425.1 endopeptidase [Candidatus Ozemobacter sp.]
MTPEKIEKLFWIVLIAWVLLRTVLLGAQLTGNTDLQYAERVRRYFSDENIAMGRQYALSGFWVKSLYGFAYVGLLLVLIRSGFFSKAFDRITQATGTGLLRNELAFTVFTLAFLQLVALPYAYYMGFLRESAMGFSNLTSFGWLIKFFKSSMLSIFLETSGILILLWVLKSFSETWVFIVPVVMGVFSLMITILFPILITPLFYEQKPLEAGEFKEKLLEISARSGLKVDEIYVIDESRYSKHTNAYFTGVGPFRRIVLYDNLIKSHTPDEAALIFAHEAGHWRHNHVAKGLSLGFLAMIALGLILKFSFPYLASVKWFGLRDLASSANLPFFLLAVMIFQLFTAPIESQISQYMERQADRAALELTGLKEVYVEAEKRLAIDNKSDLLPSPLRVFWLYSHPPALERIELADSFEKQ